MSNEEEEIIKLDKEPDQAKINIPKQTKPAYYDDPDDYKAFIIDDDQSNISTTS